MKRLVLTAAWLAVLSGFGLLGGGRARRQRNNEPDIVWFRRYLRRRHVLVAGVDRD